MGDFVFLGRQSARHGFAPRGSLTDRHLHQLADMNACDLYRKRFWAQSVAVAGAAIAIVLIAFKFFPDPV